MKAKNVYEIISALDEEQKEKLFELLKLPLPQKESSPWIRSWKNLSLYLGGAHPNILRNLYKQGVFAKYKIGNTALFKRTEIDAAIKKVERNSG